MTLEELRDLAATLRRIAILPMAEAAEVLNELQSHVRNRVYVLQKAENAL